MHQTFYPMERGMVQSRYAVTMLYSKKHGPLMRLVLGSGAMYITKAQAMTFWGLIDPEPLVGKIAVCIWEDKTWCKHKDLVRYTSKSDDYSVHYVPEELSDEEIESWILNGSM